MVIVFPDAVAPVIVLAKTVGELVPYRGLDQFVTEGLVAAGYAAGLQGETVTQEKRIIFVERGLARPGSFQDPQVALGQLRLHRIDIERLQQLRLQ